MKIVVATPLYPPEIGGPATYVQMLESQLPADEFELEVVPFASVRSLPKVIRHIAYYFKLTKAVKDADVLYALDPVSVGLPAKLAAQHTKTPLLVRVPGDYAWEQGQVRFGVRDTLDQFVENRKQYSVFVRLLHKIQSSVAQAAEAVIVPSDYMKGIVMTWDVHPARIVPIYSALHPLQVTGERAGIRNKLGLSGTVLITVGRLVPWKGMVTLIEILPQLKEIVPDIYLCIVGEGPQLSALKNKADELGVTDNVRFTGRLDKADLAEALVASDVFVLNTSYEGLSHQLLEVMHIGLPIVTTDVGGNPELIKDTVTGILVPYNDKQELLAGIERAATHDSFTKTMVANARLRVKDFNEERVVEKLVEVLRTFV